MSALLSAALARYPLISAVSVVAVLEVPSAFLSFCLPSVLPLEYSDVYSILLAFFLTLLYYVHSAQTLRQSLLLLCVTLWSFRLSFFLSSRVRAGFVDTRLNMFRGTFRRAARWGFVQALWVSVTLLPVWVGMSPYSVDSQLNALDIFALCSFAAGLGIETVADSQKAAFIRANRARPAGERRPACDVGLFKYSRFPNYFGEWVVWTAICLIAWQATKDLTRLLLPICSWFTLKIFYMLSIPLAIKAVRKRATEQQFQEWCDVSLFVPLPRGMKL